MFFSDARPVDMDHMKLLLATAIAVLAGASPAMAQPMHDCSHISRLSGASLRTSGVQCGYARDTVERALHARIAQTIAPGATQRVRVSGVVGWRITESHHFDCAASEQAISNGFRLTISCHDFGGVAHGSVSRILYSREFN